MGFFFMKLLLLLKLTCLAAFFPDLVLPKAQFKKEKKKEGVFLLLGQLTQVRSGKKEKNPDFTMFYSYFFLVSSSVYSLLSNKPN